MPLDGSGVYTPPSPEFPAIPNTTILASDFNTIMDDLATALSLAIFKDGQASMEATLNMASHKITNLTTGTNPADATNVLQVFTDPTFTGTTGTGVGITGTKATITTAVLDLTVADINIAGTTLDIIAPTTNITSTTALALTSPDTSIVSSASIDITAGTTITETATTSITLEAPTITATGSLVATMDATSTGVTATSSDNTTKLATNAFVQQVAFNAALPTPTDNAGKLVTTDGSLINWGTDFNTTVMDFADGTDSTKKASLVLSGITAGQDRQITVPDSNLILVGTTLTQTLTNKTIPIADNAFTLQDNSDATKQLQFQLSSIATATTRTITVVNEDIDLFTPIGKLLSTHTASGAATFDIEPTFLAAYDRYLILIDDLTVATNFVELRLRLKVGGSYITTLTYTTRNIDNTTTAGGAYASLFATLGNGSQYYTNLSMEILNPLSTAYEKTISLDGFSVSAKNKPAPVVNEGSTGALQGIRVYASSGNISGIARVYGIRKT